MGFEYKLLNIKDKMSRKHRNTNKLVTYYVAQRLNKSLTTYISDLNDRINYLENRKPENVLRKM